MCRSNTNGKLLWQLKIELQRNRYHHRRIWYWWWDGDEADRCNLVDWPMTTWWVINSRVIEAGAKLDNPITSVFECPEAHWAFQGPDQARMCRLGPDGWAVAAWYPKPHSSRENVFKKRKLTSHIGEAFQAASSISFWAIYVGFGRGHSCGWISKFFEGNGEAGSCLCLMLDAMHWTFRLIALIHASNTPTNQLQVHLNMSRNDSWIRNT